MRYAVYYAPSPRSALWRAGCEWLGWDAAAGIRVLPPALPGGLLARLAPLTRTAAHYGWHGTLKAPFALADGVDAAQLLDAVSALAQRFTPFDLALEVATHDGFAALRPQAALPELDELAQACVVALAPLAAAAPARDGLTLRQAALHQRWGYPHVFEQFGFHMTLAAATREAPLQAAIAQAARAHFDQLLTPTVAALALFVEPRPDEPFRFLAECRFDGQVLRHGR